MVRFRCVWSAAIRTSRQTRLITIPGCKLAAQVGWKSHLHCLTVALAMDGGRRVRNREFERRILYWRFGPARKAIPHSPVVAADLPSEVCCDVFCMPVALPWWFPAALWVGHPLCAHTLSILRSDLPFCSSLRYHGSYAVQLAAVWLGQMGCMYMSEACLGPSLTDPKCGLATHCALLPMTHSAQTFCTAPSSVRKIRSAPLCGVTAPMRFNCMHMSEACLGPNLMDPKCGRATHCALLHMTHYARTICTAPLRDFTAF